MNSFILLEQGHTLIGLYSMVELTGLLPGFMSSLTHRADIAQLPYVRRKNILPVRRAGYDTLTKIACANLDQIDSDMESYFERTQGKSWQKYKAVIVLRILVICANALPKIRRYWKPGDCGSSITGITLTSLRRVCGPSAGYDISRSWQKQPAFSITGWEITHENDQQLEPLYLPTVGAGL